MMKTVVLTASRQMELQDLPVPQLEPDGLLLRVEAAAICNTTDYKIFTAPAPEQVWPGIPAPVVMGHEFLGRVVGMGSELAGFCEGERLAGWGATHGAYAEYMQIKPDQMALMRVPEELPAVQGAFLELVIGTLRYLVTPEGWPIRTGARVVVSGLGPSGLLYVQFARLMGAAEIWVLDHNSPRIGHALKMGATRGFETMDTLVNAARGSSFDADVLIDTTGADLLDAFETLIAHRAFVVPFGIGFDWRKLLGRLGQKSFLHGKAGLAEARQAISQIEEWLREDRLDLASMVSREVGLQDVQASLEALQQRPKSMIKIVVKN